MRYHLYHLVFLHHHHRIIHLIQILIVHLEMDVVPWEGITEDEGEEVGEMEKEGHQVGHPEEENIETEMEEEVMVVEVVVVVVEVEMMDGGWEVGDVTK